MISGSPPFEGKNSNELISTILKKEPSPLTDAPDEIQRLISRALRKKKEDRYQTIEDLLADLKGLKGDQTVTNVGAQHQRGRWTGSASSTREVAAISTATTIEYVISEIKRHKTATSLGFVTLVVLLAGVGYLGYRYFFSSRAISIAVMPFANESGDPRLEYLSDGLAGDLIESLEKVRGLEVKLSIPITDKTREKLAKHDTENYDAYLLYLNGVSYARKLTEQDINKAIELFSQAINKDREYARAYAALATARRSLTMCCDGQPSELLEAKLAAQKAVELDDELAEGHSALAALIYSYDWNWTKAEKEFQRALELDPNNAISHFQYGDFLGFMGRGDEANVEKGRATELEPFEPFFASRVGSNKDPEKKLKQILHAIELDPNYYFSHSMAASTYGERKEYDKAIEEGLLSKKLSPDQTWSDVILSRIYVDAGKPEEARKILDQLLLRKKSRFVPPCNIALVYNYLGDKEQALYWLENAFEIHDAKMTSLKLAWWKNLENDPRFKDIVRRVGLPGAK